MAEACEMLIPGKEHGVLLQKNLIFFSLVEPVLALQLGEVGLSLR